MILKMIDPSINGMLHIENPNGEIHGQLRESLDIHLESPSNELPVLTFKFKHYLTCLGRDYMGSIDLEPTVYELDKSIELLKERLKELTEKRLDILEEKT